MITPPNKPIELQRPRLHHKHSNTWRPSRTSYDERLAHIERQFVPSLPLSHASRKRLLETVSSADKMRLLRGSADSPPQHSPSLSRLSPHLDADGGKRYFGSKLLRCEAALAEALEADGGDRSTVTADEADVRARKIAAECLVATSLLAEVVPDAHRHILQRLNEALDSLLYSPDHTDLRGQPMLYRTVLDKIATRKLEEANTERELAQWGLKNTRAELEVSELKAQEARAQVMKLSKRSRLLEAQLSQREARITALETEVEELTEAAERSLREYESKLERSVGKVADELDEAARQLEKSRDQTARLEAELEHLPSADECARLQSAEVELTTLRERIDGVSLVEERYAEERRLRMEYEATLGGVERTHTPRPAWDALNARAEHETRGMLTANDPAVRLDKARSSAQNAVSIYTTYLETTRQLARYRWQVPHDEPFFPTLGEGANVPVYMRFPAGEVLRNHRYPKALVETTIKEFWAFFYSDCLPQGLADVSTAVSQRRKRSGWAHLTQEAWTEAIRAVDALPADAMGNFLEAFLQQSQRAQSVVSARRLSSKQGVRYVVREFTYNFIDGCRRYNFDADVELFINVLSNQLPASAHARQMAMLDALHAALVEADRHEHSTVCKGELTREACARALRRFFCAYTEAQHAALIEVLPKFPGGSVRYVELFMEDKDGSQSPFAERLRDEWLRAPGEFAYDVEATLCWRDRGDGETDALEAGLVTPEAAAAAVRAVDPAMHDSEVERLVAAGFGVQRVGRGGEAAAAAAAEEEDATSVSGPAPVAPAHDAAVELGDFVLGFVLAFPQRAGPPPPELSRRIDDMGLQSGAVFRQRQRAAAAESVGAAGVGSGESGGPPA